MRFPPLQFAPRLRFEPRSGTAAGRERYVEVIELKTVYALGRALVLAMAYSATGDSPASAAAPAIVTTMSAEVERKTVDHGRESVRLVPAVRVVPGDLVIYTVEVRNDGVLPAQGVTFTSRIPEHMVYVANSAVGPGADVTYSIDGGRTYDRPENLVVDGPRGTTRAATPADYTHIRWTLRNALKVHSVALARFRAVLK